MSVTNGTHRKHDPMVCGLDPTTDCDMCRPQTLRLRRIEALEERLRKAGISAADMADLIWYHLEDYLEDTIARIAREEIKRKLAGVTLHAIIESSTVE